MKRSAIMQKKGRPSALGALALGWASELGCQLYFTQGLSLMMVTLMLLSFTLAFSSTQGGTRGFFAILLLLTGIEAAKLWLLKESLAPVHASGLGLALLFFICAALSAWKRGDEPI